MKKLITTILLVAFIFTGCNTTDVSSGNLLSDEDALSVVNVLIEKAEAFSSFMYEVLEFGEYRLDELDSFEAYDSTYAEFRIENLLEYLNNEIYYNRYPKDVFNFSSRQEISDYIETFALSAKDTFYGYESVFENKNGKLYYCTREISAVGMTSIENITIISKTENEIFFSGNRTDNAGSYAEFSIVKNDEGEWRLKWNFFYDPESYQLIQENEKNFERIALAVLDSGLSEFDSYKELTPDEIFRIWQIYTFGGTTQELDKLYFTKDGVDYFYTEQIEEFAKQRFRLTTEDMQTCSEYDSDLNAYRRTIYSGKSGKLKFTKIEDHNFDTYYSFEHTAPFTSEVSTGILIEGHAPYVTVESLKIN